MENAIDSELAQLLKQQVKTGPKTKWPFIVTLAPGQATQQGQGIDALTTLGFEVDHMFEAISAVSGKMTAAQALAAGALDSVVRVEYDGEMRALKTKRMAKK